MKAYSHDPNIYREHFRNQVGRALPGFKGARTQYGGSIGNIIGAIARRAMPLIKSGVKLLAPHLKTAARGIAQDVTSRVINEATTRFGGPVSTPNKRKSKRKGVIRRKKFKASTSNNDYLN